MATIDRTTVGTLNSVTASSRDFFFSSTGANSSSANTGTVAAPWLDMRNLNNVTNQLDEIQAGDRFLFKAGETINQVGNYNASEFSGISGAEIVFGAYENGAYTDSPSTRPVVSRNSKLVRTMTLSAGYTNTPVYYFPITAFAVGEGMVWEDGELLRSADTVTQILEAADGGTYDGSYNAWQGTLHGSDGGGLGVYWRPTSGSAKASEQVWIADGNWGGTCIALNPQTADIEYIRIENLELAHSLAGVYALEATYQFANIQILNCKIHDCEQGITFSAGGTGACLDTIVLTGNEIYRTAFGILLYANGATNKTVENCLIADNYLHELNWYNSAINLRSNLSDAPLDSEAIGIQNAQNNQIYCNRIENMGIPGTSPSSSGNIAISFWNGANEAVIPNGNTIFRNFIKTVEEGFAGLHNSQYTADSTNNVFRHNILIDCNVLGMKVYARGSTNKIHNNTLVNCAVGIFSGNPTSGGAQVFNNLVLNSTQDYISSAGATVTEDFDNNLFYGGVATPFRTGANATRPYAGGSSIALAAWQAVTGTPDLNSTEQDPVLTDATPETVDECMPTASSPMVGETDATGKDYFSNWYIGSSPIGALEYIANGDPSERR